MQIRAVAGAAAAVALIALAAVPYSPTFVYEGRYLIVVFGHDLSYGPFSMTVNDAEDGAQVFGYFQYARENPLPIQRQWGEIFWGAWGPSHGPWPLLANGYPAPYLNERSVDVRGTGFTVRVWEGAGLQRDCYPAFEAAGLSYERTTGGGQGWGPHGHPMGGPYHRGIPFWVDTTKFLTCVWIDHDASLQAPPPLTVVR